MGVRKKPWDKQTGETDKAYDAFSVYLEMSGRSIQGVADRLAVSRQNIEKFANKFDWRERAAAYDSSIVEALRKDKIKRQKIIAEKMFKSGNLMLDGSIEYLEKNGVARCSCRSATEMADVGSRLAIQSLELLDGEETLDKTFTINIVRADAGDVG